MLRLPAWILSTVWALLIYRLTTTPQLTVTTDTFFQAALMLGAHFFFFGVLAVLLAKSWHQKEPRLIFPWIVTSLYGAAIEFIQISVPGRSADPLDWALDTIGALVFLWLMRKYSL